MSLQFGISLWMFLMGSGGGGGFPPGEHLTNDDGSANLTNDDGSANSVTP